MRQERTSIHRQTRGPGFQDLSAEVASWLRSIGAGDGCITLFIRHTSASLTIQENADPDVLHDLAQSLAILAPEDRPYRHSTEGPDDMPAHIKTMLTSVSLSIPVAGGAMMLGTWQAVYLIEHRAHPHDREIVAHYVGE
ncbi:MAG: YjbQ family protein [Hyphomicrobiaceae bacterium]